MNDVLQKGQFHKSSSPYSVSLRYNVRRLMPSFFAASVRLPSVAFKARMMSCFSASLTDKSPDALAGGALAGATAAGRAEGGRSRGVILSLLHSTTPCSI